MPYHQFLPYDTFAAVLAKIIPSGAMEDFMERFPVFAGLRAAFENEREMVLLDLKPGKNMIFDTLEHSDLYTRLNPYFEKGFTFLGNKETTMLAPGKYDLEGDHLFAIVQEYDTKPVEEGKWEAHRKYIDIQYMVSGAEIMGIAPVDQMQVSQAYDVENDYALFHGKGEEIIVREGAFAIFYPHDVHMPGLWIGEAKKIRKIVLKVRVDF